MATTTNTKPATPKAKKEPIAPVLRITDQMKRAALSGKLGAGELDKLANLASALKTFVSA